MTGPNRELPEVVVRYEPLHNHVSYPGEPVGDKRPTLTYDRHPQHGYGWTLTFLDDADEVDEHFIPGDLTDVYDVVRSAQFWLGLRPEGES